MSPPAPPEPPSLLHPPQSRMIAVGPTVSLILSALTSPMIPMVVWAVKPVVLRTAGCVGRRSIYPALRGRKTKHIISISDHYGRDHVL